MPQSMQLAPWSPSSSSDSRGCDSLQYPIRSSGGRAGWPRRWISMKPDGLPIRWSPPSRPAHAREVAGVLLEGGHLGLLGAHAEGAHPGLRLEDAPVVVRDDTDE